MALYADIGRYFAPDGSVNEDAFRKIINQNITKLKKKDAEIWVAAYLEIIMDYLDQKGLTVPGLTILQSALDEADRCGVHFVNIPAARIARLLNFEKPLPKRKNAPDIRKKKIYAAALKVFAEEGFHMARIETIASLSGVAKGTIYTYFESKEDLLNKLLTEHYENIVEQISRICSEEDDILDQSRKLIDYWVGFIQDNPQLYRLIQSQAIYGNTVGVTMFYDFIISHLPMFKERIVALNRENKLKTTSFYTSFYGVMGFIDGVVQKWFRSDMTYPLTDELPVIKEVLFNGFVGEKGGYKYFMGRNGGTAFDSLKEV